MLSSYWEQLDTIDCGDGGGLADVQSFRSCQKLQLALLGTPNSGRDGANCSKSPGRCSDVARCRCIPQAVTVL